MALSYAVRRQLLEASLPESTEVRLELQDYLARTGMRAPDFARRINYARETVYQFLNGHYSRISSNDGLIRTAIRDFIAAHPIAAPAVGSGKLYETENTRLLRRYFYEALDHGRAYYLYGAPGTQKTYVLQHLIAELNRSEIAKNGEGRRAYYVYVRQGIRSLDLMKRVAQSCGAIGLGTVIGFCGIYVSISASARCCWSLTKPSICRLSAWRPYGNCWINRRTAGCYSPAPTNWRQSSPARPWSWSNGVPAFMLVRPCPASLKRKQPLSCTLSSGWDFRSGKSKS